MHRALKYGNLLVFCMISSLNCRVISLKELPSCCLRIGVIGSRWCDGSRDDIKALVSCCVCGVLSSKTLHHIFIISIMLAISVAGMVLPMPVRYHRSCLMFLVVAL